MRVIHTLEDEVQFEGSTTESRALDFLRVYPWARVGRCELDHVVVEEIGRNTKRVFGFGYAGASSEILPLLRYVYLLRALQGACFCSPDPNYTEEVVRLAINDALRFPEAARTPLPVLCSCTEREKFGNFLALLSANIEIASNPILLEPGIIPDWQYSVLPGNKLIPMMLVSGVSDKKTVVDAIRFVADDYKKNEGVAYTALEMHREGLCSFSEALAMA